MYDFNQMTEEPLFGQNTFQFQNTPQPQFGLLGNFSRQEENHSPHRTLDIAKQMAQSNQAFQHRNNNQQMVSDMQTGQQMAQRALAEEEQRKQQQRQMIFQLAKMFVGGGA